MADGKAAGGSGSGKKKEDDAPIPDSTLAPEVQVKYCLFINYMHWLNRVAQELCNLIFSTTYASSTPSFTPFDILLKYHRCDLVVHELRREQAPSRYARHSICALITHMPPRETRQGDHSQGLCCFEGWRFLVHIFSR